MTFDLLKKNIDEADRLIDEISQHSQDIEILEGNAQNGEQIDAGAKKLLEESITHALIQIKILNNAIPDLIDGLGFYPKLASSSGVVSVAVKPAVSAAALSPVESLSYKDNNLEKEVHLAVKKKERNKFLESLSLRRFSLRKLEKKKEQDNSIKEVDMDKYADYIKSSNKLFRNTANKMIASGSFENVRDDLIKITSPMILNSYIAVALYSTMIMSFVGIFFGILFAVLRFNLLFALLAVVAFPVITFMLFFFYPSSKRKALEKNINQELPFMVIYMAAISTSGIEPSKIFNIIVASNDYPSIQREMKKLTNYVNFYGLDLVGALRNVSKKNPSERLSQLFDGLATTITSGGELTEFLGKHSESLLFDYRLEREKYTRTAETFMNIYISVVIAAPMILMMLFILMSLGGLAAGFLTPLNLGILAVLGISMLNVAFLVFLNMKQPKF